MSTVTIKNRIAMILDIFQINRIGLFVLNKKFKKNYIRVINYHHVPECDRQNFIKQLEWYQRHFENVTWSKFEDFMNGNYCFKKKPGIILSFDDGFADNYIVAFEEMQKREFTGWYMVSAGKIDEEDYMTLEQLRHLIKKNEVIGCHTYTHHRMNKEDSEETLEWEIVAAKKKMEDILVKDIDLFCWCGGETEHYTREAAERIVKAKFKYAFMTNSYPVCPDTNPFHIQRSNIEAGWSLALVKFQIAGLMDLKFKKKREYVNRLTKIME